MSLTPEHIDGLRLRSRRPGENGGEWDAVRSWDRRTLRRLRGAGYLGRQGGYAPDQLAHELRWQLPEGMQVCEAMEQWRAAVLQLLAEQRRYARQRRELRLARAAGFATFHQYRAARYAGSCGSASVHDYCRQMGWR